VAVVGAALRTKSNISAQRLALLEHSQRLKPTRTELSTLPFRHARPPLRRAKCFPTLFAVAKNASIIATRRLMPGQELSPRWAPGFLRLFACFFYGVFYGSLRETFGPVAQRLEQGTHNPLVPGSNPGGPSSTNQLLGRSHRRIKRR
jgi:hypothetical protein